MSGEGKPLTRESGLAFWLDKWEKGNIIFHENEVNSVLKNSLDIFIAGRQNLRVFIPLCGKAVEIKWFAEMGHTVVGVECSQLAIEAFFSENSLEFTSERVNKVDGVLYKCETLPISLYMCDIMLFSREVEEAFDAIWDRGSLGALPLSLLPQYSKIMVSLMRPDCRYMIETFQYDESTLAGPPSSIREDLIDQLFGETCNWKVVEKRPDEEKHQQLAKNAVNFCLCVWLVTLK